MYGDAAFFHLEAKVGSGITVDHDAAALHAMTDEIEFLRAVPDDDIGSIAACDIEQVVGTQPLLAALQFGCSDLGRGFAGQMVRRQRGAVDALQRVGLQGKGQGAHAMISRR